MGKRDTHFFQILNKTTQISSITTEFWRRKNFCKSRFVVYYIASEGIFMNNETKHILDNLKQAYFYQKEYLQAAEEILESLDSAIEANPLLMHYKVIDRFVRPDRVISFRVSWIDDRGDVQVNTGYRVQFNNAIGPYKGGLRFHSSVNESILKFLGLEQVLKNSLTGLPLGGAKGGSDFDPHGKSDEEVMRFCQAFMTELYRYLGDYTDVPAGDIGVGAREIGYLYGQYKRLTHLSDGVLTGKGIPFGGSLVRPQATGYGLCYFAERALQKMKGTSFSGKTVVVSGSGNVATFACEKATQLGGKVVAMSDSAGYIYDSNGIDLSAVREIKEIKRGRIKDYILNHPSAKYVPVASEIWTIPCDIALPCATQNELDENSARKLIENGVIGVFEGANMPCTIEAQKLFIASKVLYSPGKASNAGGVAVSGLEMSQNSERFSWSFAEVDLKLQEIMSQIFDNCLATSIRYGKEGDLLFGANVFGFEKVSSAMLSLGII